MLTRIEDWTALKGKHAEARYQGKTVCMGIVGAVTEDGETLWMQPYFGPRRVFSKKDSYELWGSHLPR